MQGHEGPCRRQGYTYRAAERIREVMQPLGEVEFDYLMLKDADLAHGLGCFACFQKGEEHCPCRDDAPAIEQRLDAAARDFYRALKRGTRGSPGLRDLPVCHAQRISFDELREHFPADYEYWRGQGWLEPGRKYYADVPVNLFYDTAGRIAGRYIRRQVRRDLAEKWLTGTRRQNHAEEPPHRPMQSTTRPAIHFCESMPVDEGVLHRPGLSPDASMHRSGEPEPACAPVSDGCIELYLIGPT